MNSTCGLIVSASDLVESAVGSGRASSALFTNLGASGAEDRSRAGGDSLVSARGALRSRSASRGHRGGLRLALGFERGVCSLAVWPWTLVETLETPDSHVSRVRAACPST